MRKYSFYIAYNDNNKPVFTAQEETDNPMTYPNLIYSDVLNKYFEYKKIRTMEQFKYVVEYWNAFARFPSRFSNVAHLIEESL